MIQAGADLGPTWASGVWEAVYRPFFRVPGITVARLAAGWPGGRVELVRDLADADIAGDAVVDGAARAFGARPRALREPVKTVRCAHMHSVSRGCRARRGTAPGTS